MATVAVAAVLVAPAIGGYLRTQSVRLAAEAKTAESTDPHKAAVQYQMAAFLQPGDHRILRSLADMYVRLDQPDRAIAVLRQLPLAEAGKRIAELQLASGQAEEALKTLNEMINERVTAEVLVAKSRVLMELDRGVEACATAKDATGYSMADSAVRLQLGLCQIAQADESGYAATIASLGNSEAAKTLQSAHAYKLALARELYAVGLLRTSERILDSLDTSATERYILTGRIKLAQRHLDKAKEQLVRATKLDPASVDAHKLLQEILIKLGDDVGASEQAKQIKSLQAGLL